MRKGGEQPYHVSGLALVRSVLAPTLSSGGDSGPSECPNACSRPRETPRRLRREPPPDRVAGPDPAPPLEFVAPSSPSVCGRLIRWPPTEPTSLCW